MRMKRVSWLAVVAVAVLALSACGLFKSTPSPTAPGAVIPVVNSFAADSSRIQASLNVSTFLRWDVTAVGEIACRVDPVIGNVPQTSSVEVRPASTTTYTLSCTNAAGTVNRTVTVTVF